MFKFQAEEGGRQSQIVLKLKVVMEFQYHLNIRKAYFSFLFRFFLFFFFYSCGKTWEQDEQRGCGDIGDTKKH